MRNALILVCGLFSLSCTQTEPESASSDAVSELARYIEQHDQSPEDYVISKFQDHDIVLLGERHRLKHDVALVHSLIPRLYRAGVYNLGIEFANYADQQDIHRLVTGDTYDEDLARQIQFNQWPFWGFQDYIDIFKVAWELNSDLPTETRPFRIIGLNARSDWSHVWTPEQREDREVMKRVWAEGYSDEFMARVVQQEFIDRGEKALLYMGANHAYTRYRQPYYDFEADSLVNLNDRRTGNRIYASIGDRAFNIRLHSAWPSAGGYSVSVRAADGVIDEVIAALPAGHRRVGFDVVGTPFADLVGETSYWKHGHPDFTLADYCDGYIIQMPLEEYEGVSVARGFISDANRLEAIAQIANPNPRVKDTSRAVEDLMGSMEQDTRIQEIFRKTIRDYE